MNTNKTPSSLSIEEPPAKKEAPKKKFRENKYYCSDSINNTIATTTSILNRKELELEHENLLDYVEEENEVSSNHQSKRLEL